MTETIKALEETVKRLTLCLRELHDFSEPSSHVRYKKRSKDAFRKASKLLRVVEPAIEDSKREE